MAIERYDPRSVGIYFAAILALTLSDTDPILLLASVIGAVILYLLLTRKFITLVIVPIIPLISACFNAAFNHNGMTPLLIINDNPITLEALAFGGVTGLMLTAALFWSFCFTYLMTSDRMSCLLGMFSPKIALLLSMTLRAVPLFKRQAQRVAQSQKGLGLYGGTGMAESIKSGGRIFSVMLTWALENGVITADSMAARGYGICRRTSFSVYHFSTRDVITVSFCLLFSTAALLLRYFGGDTFDFYPGLSVSINTIYALPRYIAFSSLALAPAALETAERLKWKFSELKI